MLLKLYDGFNMVECNIILNPIIKAYSVKVVFVSRHTIVCHVVQEKWGVHNTVQEKQSCYFIHTFYRIVLYEQGPAPVIRMNHFWKKYLSTRRPGDLINFKSVNNQLRSLTRNLRKDYEKKLVQGVRSRPKAFWKYVNSRTKVEPGITELVSTDGSAIQSDIDMATHFNEYFSSVFTCEDTASIPTVVLLPLMTPLKSLLKLF